MFKKIELKIINKKKNCLFQDNWFVQFTNKRLKKNNK